MKRWVLVLALVPSTAQGAELWVWGDAEVCPGEGTQAAPFCAPNDALEAAQPGDTINVRGTAQRYTSLAIDSQMAPGTEGAPITVRAAPGEAPVVERIVIDSQSYWVVEGFTVDGPGTGVRIVANNGDSEGIVVQDNRVLATGFTGITAVLEEDGATNEIRDTIIQRNVVHGASTMGIRLSGTIGSVVEGNHVTGTRCSDNYDPRTQEGSNQQVGIALVSETTSAVVRGNVVEEFPTCPSNDVLRLVGIRARSAQQSIISENLVSVVGADGGGGRIDGISVHGGSSDSTVVGNIVAATDCGLAEAADYSDDAGGTQRSQWAHNVVLDANKAVCIGGSDDSSDAVFEFNVLQGHNRAVFQRGEAENLETRRNVFWSEAEFPFDRGEDVVGFESWRSDCACDEGSLFADPELDGLIIPPDSVAVDLAQGSPWRERFHGLHPDAGALEPPIIRGVETTPQGDVRLTVENAVAPPLVPSNCEAFRVVRNDAPVALSECTMTDSEGTTVVDLVLASGLHRDDVAFLEVLDLLSDSRLVGNVAARVEATRIELDTTMLEPEGTPGEGSTGSEEDEASLTPPSDHGCRMSEPPPFFLLLLLVYARLRKP